MDNAEVQPEQQPEQPRPQPPPDHMQTVSLKLPPYWPNDLQIWFAQVEAQFSTRGINAQRTMFDYVVANLTPDIAIEIRDLILRPPEENPYNVLKAQLIKRTAASEQRRLQQLLSTEELGDRKPTQLLRRLQQLAGDTPGLLDGNFLKELFLQRLPSQVRMVLASTRDGTPIEDLAQLADKIIEVAAPPIVSTVTTPSADMEQLRSEIASLTKLVSSLQQQQNDSDAAPNPLTEDDHPDQLIIDVLQTQRIKTLTSAGITRPSKMTPGSANHPVRSREMSRPTTDGGRCPRPAPK